ncbi:MAG: DUF2628 domain-containing protein [Hyphomicrobiales bacterium]
MRLFTVHLPLAPASGRPMLDRAVFVREGFSVAAFLLSVLWCLWRGLWIPALLILVASGALLGIGRALDISPSAQMLAEFVLALLVGLEASNLWRSGLGRQGYVDAGVVAASDRAEAEEIFFGRTAMPMPEASGPAPDGLPRSPPSGRGRAADDVVGLFPEYRGR